MDASVFKPGSSLTFRRAGEILRGIVNGEPRVIELAGQENVYVPVHVAETNKNLMVHASNVVGLLEPA